MQVGGFSKEATGAKVTDTTMVMSGEGGGGEDGNERTESIAWDY